MATEFSTKVIQSIKKIPKGKVATYSQIAALAGKPHAARGVSWILNSSSKAHALPWHRVINSKGQIAFPWGTRSFLKQKKFLEAEGVKITNKTQIDLAKFQWKKRPAKVRKRNQPTMFS